MPTLQLTHDEIHHRLYTLTYLHESSRAAVYDIIKHLNERDDWYAESFKRELKSLEHRGVITEDIRHKLEQEF